MKINTKNKWIEKPSPKSMRTGTGWFGEMNKIYTYNREYAAMTREVNTEWGKVIHCAFRNKDGTDSYGYIEAIDTLIREIKMYQR